jgi:uncharacterized protein YjbI with pentapeptide repeats
VGLETRPPSEERPASHGREAAPAESRVASPATEPQAPAGSTPDLLEFAKKANDLEAIKKAVDDAASVGGGLWLSYLFALFYFAVAAGAVTHEDLFFERAVKLPFLGIDLPLLAFFFLAPILFVIVHAYTLVHLVMLTEKAKRFRKALHESGRNVTEKARENLRWQLPSNVFIQFLAGPSDLREGAFGWLLRAIAWITLVIAPILLLLMMQVQFLPFHSSVITWTHRLALLADLILIWWLCGKVLSSSKLEGRHRLLPGVVSAVAFALSLGAVLFSWTTATFRGELQDHEDSIVTGESGLLPREESLHDLLFNLPIDDTIRRRKSPFSSTLVLSGLNVYEGLKIDDPEKAKWRDYVFRARGRDLTGANFDLAILRKVDFAGARLEGASFKGAQTEGTSFAGATLFGASFIRAKLDNAQLQGASLNGAQLQGASLVSAQLQGASLANAQLGGASLKGAQLQGASLNGAQLEGASLDGAQLQGASFADAQLRGVSLAGAELQGALLGQRQLDVALSVPAQGREWQKSLEGTREKDAAVANTLAAELKTLVCSGGYNAVNVLRGVLRTPPDSISRLEAAGPEAPALVDFIMSKDCPLSASLTDDDRARLLHIKWETEKAKN